MNQFKYLFGFEQHQLCRSCPGAVWIITRFPSLPWTKVEFCGWCCPSNFGYDFARKHYER